ncbi:MAG TPA: ADOP family duplicated permease [Gemmatimonadaceae bacterium]|nr:ADOP family duplicated permease [Gemmatimonadaceae bacterium]
MNVRRWFRRGVELDEEIRAHLAMAARERIARGETAEAAELAARREFGNVGLVKELTRSYWRGAAVERTGREARQLLRGLARRPGVTIAVVVTLALGIGANAAVFTITDRLLVREPAGVPDPGTLHRVYATRTMRGRASIREVFSAPEVRAVPGAVAPIARASPVFGPIATASGGHGIPESRIEVTYTGATFFSTLGVRPAMGRFFTTDENRFDAPSDVAVISYNYWTRELHGARNVLGGTLRIEGRPYTIIGIGPRDFTGIDVQPADVWVPLASLTRFSTPNERWYESAGLLAYGLVMRVASPSNASQAAVRAQEALRRVARTEQLGDSSATVILGSIIEARGPQTMTREDRIALLLSAITLMVLFVACANAANLLLARALHRRRELAVRLALGISRRRLAAHLLLESVILGLLSAAAASIAATWLAAALRRLIVPDIHWRAAFDLRVAAFTFGIALLIGLVVGVAPALEVSRTDISQALKSGRREGGRRSGRIRAALMVTQAALSVVLLIGAGLFLRSLTRVQQIDVGYDVDHVVTASTMFLPEHHASLKQVAERARALPGVSAAALTAATPLDGMLGARLFSRAGDSLAVPARHTGYMAVEPSYFDATGIRVDRGRALSGDDRVGTAPVTVVSHELARGLWPGRDPLGECIRIGGPTARCYTVVGVARDVHPFRLIDSSAAMLYVSLSQPPESLSVAGLVLRTRGDPAPVARWLTRALGDTASDPQQRAVAVMADRLAPQYRPWRMGAQLLAGLGVLGLIIAAFGLYAVTSYLVTQRTRELAVRIAIGARAGNIVRTVLGSALRLVLVGIVLGTGIALAAGQSVAGLLYDTSPADPLILAAAAIVLIVTACVAVLIPVRRAVRVDPLIALRAE